MKRETFVKSAGAGVLASLASTQAADAAALGRAGKAPPNILFILVDELRFPSVFPKGIRTPGEFLARFMPNTFELWKQGVKFGGHHTAGVACTPARGCLITGLYTQQSWLVQTILSTPDTKYALQPHLNKVYPTYGRLLRRNGYQTPYIGKWHVSLESRKEQELELYGFDGLTQPDPTGSNLQGTVGNETEGYLNDIDIARQAVRWLHSGAALKSSSPWCLTVSFINPHDREFFWAGTEFQTYNAMFPPDGPNKPFTYYSTTVNDKAYEPTVKWNENPLKNPPHFEFPVVPPNWETPKGLAEKKKPSTQLYSQLFSQAIWGGISYDPQQTGFTLAPYPVPPNGTPPKQYAVASAPFDYWQRGLDSYAQIMNIVDRRIGEVLHAFLELPQDVRSNTVIVFTSDHGEYAGAHGYVSGKLGSCYEEAYHVPLIVADPTGRFNNDLDDVRSGLTSSVDMLPLLVSLGHNGSHDWMTRDLAEIYGNRHDILAMLRSSATPGRNYLLAASDEVAPGFYNFNGAPGHIMSLRTQDAKLGVYVNWVGRTDQIDKNGLEREFYDYSTERGRLELDSEPDHTEALAMQNVLLNDLVPTELRAPLPVAYRVPQAFSREAYLLYDQLVRNYTPSQDGQTSLAGLLGYGREF